MTTDLKILERLDKIKKYYEQGWEARRIIDEPDDDKLISICESLALALKALDWYANWDWTDKYVQPVPKRAKECIEAIKDKMK